MVVYYDIIITFDNFMLGRISFKVGVLLFVNTVFNSLVNARVKFG